MSLFSRMRGLRRALSAHMLARACMKRTVSSTFSRSKTLEDVAVVVSVSIGAMGVYCNTL